MLQKWESRWPRAASRSARSSTRYIALVGSGTADEIVALYADGATVEDPVGSDVLTGAEAIRGLLRRAWRASTRRPGCVALRIAGGEAAFHFEITTRVDGVSYTVAPVDVMTFDDDGQVTSMRAFWSDQDMVIA